MGDACDSISTRKVVIYKLGSAVVERNVVEHSAYELHGRMQCGRRGQQPVPARLHAGQRPERRRWHLIYLISLPAVGSVSVQLPQSKSNSRFESLGFGRGKTSTPQAPDLAVSKGDPLRGRLCHFSASGAAVHTAAPPKKPGRAAPHKGGEGRGAGEQQVKAPAMAAQRARMLLPVEPCTRCPPPFCL